MPPTTTSTATKQSDWYAEVAGYVGTWATVGPPTQTSQSTKVADGGAPEETLPGDPTWQQMTIGRPFKRDRDFSIFRRATAEHGQAKTITVFCKGPGGVIADKFTVLGRIAGVTGPQGDRMSSQPSSIEIVFDVDDCR